MMKMRVLAVFLLLMNAACAGEATGSAAEICEKYVSVQAYARLMPHCKIAAEQGHAPSQAGYGLLFEYGLWGGIGKDLPTAFFWYRKSADGGHPQAQRYLGHSYLQGNAEAGIEKDGAAAEKWYRRAAENGDAISQFALGRMLLLGLGIPQDPQAALLWFYAEEMTSDEDDRDIRRQRAEFMDDAKSFLTAAEIAAAKKSAIEKVGQIKAKTKP